MSTPCAVGSLLVLLSLAQPAREPLPFWETHEGYLAAATAHTLAANNPLGSVGTRLMLSEQPLLHPEWNIVLEAVPPLDPRWLEEIKDGTGIPDLRKKAPDEIKIDEYAYFRVFNQAAYYSWMAPADLFETAGREHEHVTFTHLWRDPEGFRGKVVPAHGKLIRVRKLEPTKPLAELGVKELYEGFIVGPTKFTSPYWVVFPTLPEGVPVREDLDIKVKFWGYYVKKVRYTAGNAERLTNLLIGPTLYPEQPAVAAPPTEPPPPFSRVVLFSAVGGLLGIAALIIVCSWYFRRGDRHIQSRLDAIRQKSGLEQFEPSDLPPEVAPPVERENGPGPKG